jgi:uncharacterized membrane protein YebE (DUF533 family)
MKFDFEWQTVALYAAIGVVCVAALLHWHRNQDKFKDFTLIDLVAEEGKLSGRKFMEFGSWVVVTAAMVVSTVRGTLTAEWIGIYTAVFVLGRAAGQAIHTYQSTTTRKAEIQRGRFNDPQSDGPTVEEEEALARGDRRSGTRRF